ncbi:hypothetical protein CBR_g38995 [Chara braunii]|uniref:CCHC-type domain-containing protein n=1 Tax=Chara braunii TaxID=69332 RepID=A0A388K147_CHABU|nr:hypothetical protein CBR_g38995 [Chara braunii]|eukprot:GBG63683.1 hypothetical protein CBR_g38995 [Chara braunii]
MAPNVPTSSTIVRTCYNCSDPGHFVRWCPHPRVSQPNHVIVSVETPLVTTLASAPSTSVVSNSASTHQGGGSYQKGSGWYQAQQRLEYLENTVALIKIRHDTDVEREKNRLAEEEKAVKMKEEEERRALEKKEREETNKALVDSLNCRLDSVCLALSSKRLEEVEALHKSDPVRITTPSISTMNRGQASDDVFAKLMAEQERMKTQIEDSLAAKSRLEKLERELEVIRQARDDAIVDAEVWRQEATRPGSKRGCVNLSTPSVHATVEPCRTPAKVASVRVDYKELKQFHNMEVEKIKEMRLIELNGPERPNEKLEKTRLRIVQLEADKASSTPRSNLRARLDEVVAGSEKGKKKTLQDPAVQLNDRKTFIKETRKALPQTKDKLAASCAKEGIVYTTIRQTIDDIVAKRVLDVFPPLHVDSVNATDDLSVDVAEDARGDSDVS